jgi:hypothetical protein
LKNTGKKWKKWKSEMEKRRKMRRGRNNGVGNGKEREDAKKDVGEGYVKGTVLHKIWDSVFRRVCKISTFCRSAFCFIIF